MFDNEVSLKTSANFCILKIIQQLHYGVADQCDIFAYDLES